MTTLRALAAWLVCTALLAAPRLAQACSVCTAARDDKTQDAFMWTTLLLSVIPIVLFGILGFVFWRRARAEHREEALESETPGAAAPTA